MVKDSTEKEYFSTAQAAKILGISRVALFNRIKKGEIRAQKVGRNYIIAAEDISPLLGGELNETQKKDIHDTVGRAIKEYKETFDLLGKE